MKKVLFLLIAYLFFGTASNFAQVDQSTEVGIVEHLGDTIPLDLKFVNEKSQPVTLRQLINKPTILSFVYFDCPGLCSPLLEGVGTVIQKSDMKLGEDYQVITISFNFRDTPEKAKIKKDRFVDKYSKGKGNGWIFLTTDSTSIFEITTKTGFITKAVGFDFVHPSAIIAISPSGKITRYLYGIDFMPIDLKLAIAEANKEQSRPSIQKLLLLCYSYDQDKMKFGLDVTKIGGILIILFIIAFVLIFLVKPRSRNNKIDKQNE